MGRVEIYCGGWSISGEYEVPDRGEVGEDGVTAMVRACIERDGLFRVRVGGRLVALGAGALSNSVWVFGV